MKDKALEKQKKFKLNTGTFYGWPMGLWFMIFFIVPLVIILVYSFLKKGDISRKKAGISVCLS